MQDLQTAHEDYTTKLNSLEARLNRAEDKAADAEARSVSLQKDVDAKEEARKITQSELDDLFVVLGDLEEKRAKDKVSISNKARSPRPRLTYLGTLTIPR